MPSHDLGITVMPEYVQSEGVDGVLDRITGLAGATSLTTSPYVAALAARGLGHREPPGDGGKGGKRLLDRPLWGQRELSMTAAPSFIPDATLYDGLTYRPPVADALSQAEGGCVGRFLDAAKARGLETWMQVQAAIPPCYRVQFGGPVPADESLMPDGAPVPNRADRNASLASPDLRAYVRAFVRDLWATYPQMDGLKFDWPEYPVYHFDALFFDFNPAVAPIAARAGLDFDDIRQGVERFLTDLGDGTVRRRKVALDGFDTFRDSLFAVYPVLAQMLTLRRAVVTDYATFLRSAVHDASGGRAKLFLQGFPPPLNVATGFDPADIAQHCDLLGVKFYTMHWPMIEADYMAALQSRAGFAPPDIAPALARILSLAPTTDRDPAAIGYPDPDQPHTAASTDMATKLAQTRASVADGTPVVAMAHGYGPLDDVMRRFTALQGGPIHVNRYAYLSDAKLAAIGAAHARSGE